MKVIPNEYLRSSLKRLYWKQGRRVLAEIQAPVAQIAGTIDPQSLKERVAYLMREEPMAAYLKDLWVRSGSLFAVDTIKRVHKVARKQEEDIDYWEDYFRWYTRERSMLKAREILTTQERLINTLIDQVLETGFQQGLGVPEMQRQIRDQLAEGMTAINKYQAERIARTEINGASNTGSFEGARQTGLDIQKYWSTSGLPGIRKSHLFYESLGPVGMDYSYAPGLKYPGDPGGSAEEVINCRCSIGYNVD